MKNLIFLLLFALSIVGINSYAAVVTDSDITGEGGGGVSEGTDVGFGNITATSIDSTAATFDTTSSGDITTGSLTVSDTIEGNYLMLQGTFGSGTSLTATGAGTRMFFQPKTGAIRAGTVAGTEWDTASVGNNSAGFGLSNIISGTNAFGAGGSGNNISGASAFGTGVSQVCSGSRAACFGSQQTNAGTSTLSTGAANSNTSADYSLMAGLFLANAGVQATYMFGEYLSLGASANHTAIFGSYSNATERDANVFNTPDAMKLANMDLDVDGFIEGKYPYGEMTEEVTGLGTRYDVYTTFSLITSYGTTKTSSNITASASSGTLTLGAAVAGEQEISVDIGVLAVGGPELVFGLFRNLTTEIHAFTRPVQGVHHHDPTLANLTSDTGTAAYDTHSSLENLFYADGTEVWIDEATSGSNPLVYTLTFNGAVLYPTIVEFINVLYDGTAAHELEAEIRDYNGADWDAMRLLTKDFPDAGGSDAYRYYNREFAVPSPVSDYVNTATREAQVRIRHVSTGSPGDNFRIDKARLHDDHNSAAIHFGHLATLSAGDTISLKVKSNLELPIYFSNIRLKIGEESN